MSHLTLQGDNVTYKPVGLTGDSSLALTLVDTGTSGFAVEFLGLRGTTSVGIGIVAAAGSVGLDQLADFNNTLTTVTISGSDLFVLGAVAAGANSGDGVVTDIAATAASPTTIHSSLTLINASATTGTVDILAGATNTRSAGSFDDGAILNANITVTYTGLRSRAARVMMSSRTTPRTVSSPMATDLLSSPWAEPVRRLSSAQVPPMMLTSELASSGPAK